MAKEFVAEISFNHVQPVESSIVILGETEEEVRATITELFDKRQDLKIVSVHEKPDNYRSDSNVVNFEQAKKDLN